MKPLSTLFLGALCCTVAHAQCVPGTACDDGDPCTDGDVYSVLPGEVVCGPGTAEFPNPSATSEWASLSAQEQRVVSPFMHDVEQRRFRKQYMFLASELDVQANQMAGNVFATQGLGTCEPATAIAFYIEVPVTEADRKNWQFVITLKHAPNGVNNLSGMFDNSIDPGAGCASSPVEMIPATTTEPGWSTFALSSPFQWDGERNVILEVAVSATAGGATPGVLPVRYTTVNGTAPSDQLTYSAYTAPPYAMGFPCTPLTPTPSICDPLNTATILGDCGTFGSSNLRPAVLFIGGVTTATAPECLCSGVLLDTDADGLADCADPCPLGLNPGEPCDDGNEFTTDEVINEACVCASIAMGLAEAANMRTLRAWPVPCGHTLFLDRPVDGMIIDAFGQQVGEVWHSSHVSLSDLRSGAYVLRTTEHGIVRFVKE